MKKLLPLFSCLLLIGCGEKKETGDNGASDKDEVAGESVTAGTEAPVSLEKSEGLTTVAVRGDDISYLPILPEEITKEFIMGLWAKPHDDRGMIKELQETFTRAGTWRVLRKRGSSKRDLVTSGEALMTLKVVDRRFEVWEWKDTDWVGYSVATFDHVTGKYRWWELRPDGSIGEWTGRRYWRDLMEWKLLGDGPQVTLRQKFVSTDRKRWNGTGEIGNGKKVLEYLQDEFTWLSDLSEAQVLPEAE